MFEEIYDQVLFVDALHDNDDAACLLVVWSRYQRRAVPLDATRAGGLRMGIVEFERVINDEEIAAAPRKRSLDRGCVTTSAEGGVDFAIGIARDLHRRECSLIKRVAHNLAKVVGVRFCYRVGAANLHNPYLPIITQTPT